MRKIEHAVTIDGTKLLWTLHREQQFTTEEGWKGVSIHVRLAESTRARRELYLEYPAIKTQKVGFTRTDRVVVNIRPVKVEADIRLALAGGWDPESRGGPLFFELDEPPF
jgi:hypothetical protein